MKLAVVVGFLKSCYTLLEKEILMKINLTSQPQVLVPEMEIVLNVEGVVIQVTVEHYDSQDGCIVFHQIVDSTSPRINRVIMEEGSDRDVEFADVALEEINQLLQILGREPRSGILAGILAGVVRAEILCYTLVNRR